METKNALPREDNPHKSPIGTRHAAGEVNWNSLKKFHFLAGKSSFPETPLLYRLIKSAEETEMDAEGNRNSRKARGLDSPSRFSRLLT
jgi:hypothetical protein